MSKNIQNIINKLGETNTLIIIAAVSICTVGLFFIYRSIRLKKFRKKTIDVENRLNAIKSLPIQYRLGRVQNIAKNMPTVLEKSEEFQKRYDELMTTHKDRIALLINEVDEQLYFGKLSKVSSRLKEIEPLLKDYENNANTLLVEVEEITEIENIQRIQIIKIKEKYRAALDSYEAIRMSIEDKVPQIVAFIKELNNDFIKLEELMNTQDFNQANKHCQVISERITFLEKANKLLPDILTVAIKYIPKRLDSLNQTIVDLTNHGYSLAKLNVDTRLANINNQLDKVNNLIQNLNLDNIPNQLDEITRNINSLFDSFETEQKAHEEFKNTWKIVFDKVSEIKEKFDYSIEEYQKLLKLYVNEDQKMDLSNQRDSLQAIINHMMSIRELIDSNDFSYKEIVDEMKELLKQTELFEHDIQYFFDKRDQMYMTEKRALDELENINIVLLEIKSQIKNNHLPVINESYKDYISDSYKKANEISFLCKSRPIILENLSKQVDIARDIIYKLYDNVHNLVVTAEMVEEAIVFGNRYRSSFLEVNTELTKTEVLFRNGEYTRALAIAVDIIEKIQPGSYERLIHKNNHNHQMVL